MRMIQMITNANSCAPGSSPVPPGIVLDTTPPPSGGLEIYISPRDDLQQVWLDIINAERSWAKLGVFGISNRPIVQALIEARKRSVSEFVLIDHKQACLHSDLHQELLEAGASVLIKHSSVLLHDKIGIFGQGVAILGSWNLSGSAEAQDNSLVVIRDPAAVAQMDANWNWMLARDFPGAKLALPGGSP
jgi:phosphatidylserine/phosphatidylglycerophosphate/cardiolipin synthase-like enzyme